jgi:rubrerythrin
MPHLYARLTVIEILGIAIKKELDAATFYRKLAEHIVNPIVKNRFLALAKDERLHRALLLAEYKRMTGEAKAPPTPAMEFARDEKFDFQKFGVDAALQFAIAAERDAQKLYSEAAKISADPRGRRMLDYLVEFERGHERQLKAEMDFFKKAPLWFEDTEDLIHVGP